MSLKIIAAITRTHVIGLKNQMPWHIPEDLAYFKKTTLGHTVIMGKNTYYSIGKALPGRKNIVLSRNPDFSLADAEVYRDFASAIREHPDAFVIGGAQLFALALPYARYLYITHIDKDISGDAWFPKVDFAAYTRLSCQKSISADGHYPLSFCIYERLS